MNDNNREHFGKKVYLDEKKHWPNYLRSTIGFIYENNDKKPMLPLNRDISDIELKGLFVNEKKRSGSIGHTKVDTKPQNTTNSYEEMQKSYHN